MVAGAGRSKNFVRPKLKVKINFKTLRSRLLPILKCLEAGNYPAKTSRMLGLSKPQVAYYVKKLEQAGLIRRERRTNIVIFSVTRKGSNFLTGSESCLFGSGVWRLHAAKYRFGLVADGRWPVDWRRVEKMNWTALLGLEGGVTVEKTPSSVIVHVETLYGKNPVELLDQARALADRTARALMLKYGCKLAEGKLCRRPHIAIDDPVAEFLSRYFEISAEDRKMDRSEGLGEFEAFTPQVAIDYMMMPEKVKALEGKLEALEQLQETVVSKLDRLLDLFKPLFTMNNTARPTESPSDARRKDLSYVS